MHSFFKILFYLIGICFIYIISTLSLFIISLISLNYNIVYEGSILNNYQKIIYTQGYRRVWQDSIDCVVFDDQLLYKPKIGSCNFSNPEFETRLNFNKEGRVSKHPDTNISNAIAMIGDSFTMGWGVEDNETFSWILEQRTGRKVYNLGVSSYGTYRELMRLKQTGIMESIDTIIIQYCANDIKENQSYLNKTNFAQDIEKFNMMAQNSQESIFERHSIRYLLRMWIEAALREPLEILNDLLSPNSHFSFQEHYMYLEKVLDEFEFIKSKRVIVFYSNGFGRKFDDYYTVVKNTPTTNSDIDFADLNVTDKRYYYKVDDHLNVQGHQEVADRLYELLKE